MSKITEIIKSPMVGARCIVPLPHNQSNFLFYTGNDGKINVEVFLKDETVCLTQKAMAELFGVKMPAISKHLCIFESGKLQKQATLSILETVHQEGSRSAEPHNTLRPKLINDEVRVAV